MTNKRPKKILFLHGLESGVNGSKVQYLRKEGFDVLCPSLDTESLRAYLKDNKVPSGGVPLATYQKAKKTALKALKTYKPDIVVGSSFGGGLAAVLINEEYWIDKPAVLLAPAATKLFGITSLKSGNTPCLVSILHGKQDKVVPVTHSRDLYDRSSAVGVIQQVKDGHRLSESHHFIRMVVTNALEYAEWRLSKSLWPVRRIAEH